MTKEEFVERFLLEQKERKRRNTILNNPDYIKDKLSRAYRLENTYAVYKKNKHKYGNKTKAKQI